MIFKIKSLNNLKIEISFYFLTVIAMLVVSDRSNISLYFFLSIIIHELGHLLIIWCNQVKISKICFEIYGINIKIDNINHHTTHVDIVVLLGGSLANFIFAFVLYLTNQNMILMVVNIMIGIFNLLPVESLDGGKILNIVLFSFLPMKTAYNISMIISLIFISIFSTINFLFIIHGSFNLSLTILCVILILKIIRTF